MKRTLKAELGADNCNWTKSGVRLCHGTLARLFACKAKKIKITYSDKEFHGSKRFQITNYGNAFDWRTSCGEDEWGLFYTTAERYIRKFIFGRNRVKSKIVWVRVVADRSPRPKKTQRKPVKKH